VKYLLSILLFFLPFLVLPFGISPYESPKVVVGELLLIILVLATLLKGRVFTKKKVGLFSPILLITILSFIFYFTPLTIFGNAFRMQGAVLVILLLGLGIVSSKLSLWFPSSRILYLLFGLQFIFAFFIVGSSDRAIGTLGEPNALAAFALFFLPFALFNSTKVSKKLLITSVIISFLIILLSGSRSGLIGLGLEITFYFLSQRITLSKAATISVFLFLFSLGLPFTNSQQLYENRVDIWTTAFHAGLRQPILGWGIGNTESALLDTIKLEKNNLRGYYVDSSHNIFLDWWVQGGLVGLLSFTIIVGVATWTFIKKKQKRELMLLLGLITALSFNPASVVSLIQLWWLLGQGSPE